MEKQITLGVIGGLGPIATAHFMELITVMTRADTDQEHLPMIIYSAPYIPDRTAYILDNTKESPLPGILSVGQALEAQGVGCIAIPCITAHYFYDRLEQTFQVPLINGVRETVAHLKHHGIRRVGIMATSGTVQAGIFHRELEKQGLEAISPDAEGQAQVMHLIFENIKAGKPADMARFHACAQGLRRRGAEAIILGCTELSLIKRDYPLGAGFVDAMEVLAQQAVLKCGKALNDGYECLITR